MPSKGRARGSRNAGQGLRQYEAAQILDLTTAAISKMARSGELKCLPDGTIDPDDPKILEAQGIDAPVKRGRGRPRKEDAPREFIDLNYERARRERANAEKAELELRIARGDLVDSKATTDAQTQIAMLVAEGLEDAVEQLVARLVSMTGHAEHPIRELVEMLVFEVRERMVDEIESRAE